MSYILSILLGVIINRIRGGLLSEWLTGKGMAAFIGGKMINDVVFACWFTLLAGLIYNGVVDGSPDYSINFNIFAALIMFASMWLGRAPGWGVYIGGIIYKKVNGEKEIEQIDELVLSKEDHPVLRNVAALSLRGLMWTVPLAVGFLLCKMIFYPEISSEGVIWLALSGMLMGSVYWFTIELSERILRKGRPYGWALGEYVWGGILWFFCSLVV